MKVSYSDGGEVESRIVDLIRKGKDLTSSSLLASEHYDNWDIRYHLCPERSNLFRHFDFEGLDVLEFGAGMGGASRFTAETARSLVAVEGADRRMSALKQRLRDLDNWQGVVSDIQSFDTDRRFDVVCIVGVLEFAELYIDPPPGISPFVWMLKKAKSMLKPGGLVAVAIENRNGIKYWAGAPDGQTGQMYDGICGYPADQSPRTFARTELQGLFREAGLQNIEEFYPWPDFKTPHAVLSKHFVDRFPELAADIAVDAMNRELPPEISYFPMSLALQETVSGGLFADLSNSFLFVAGKEPTTYIRGKLLRRMYRDNEYAWHYSIRRKRPIRTVFRLSPGYPKAPIVEKEPLDGRPSEGESPSHSDYVVWKSESPSPAFLEPKVAHLLRKTAYFHDRRTFEKTFLGYLRWALSNWELDTGHLQPAAFDAIPSNAVLTHEGYNVFDLECQLDVPMPKSWFVFRNVWDVRDALPLFRKPSYKTCEEMYERLCAALSIEPNLEHDIRREAMVQSDVFRRVSADESFTAMERAMRGANGIAPFPRDAHTERMFRIGAGDRMELISRLQKLEEENSRLLAQLDRKSVKLALSLEKKLQNSKLLRRGSSLKRSEKE